MSNHPSTYEPKSAIAKWFDDRLPLPRLMHDQFVDFPTPRNLNYMWTFGGILTFCLVAQIVTGIVLAMHYVPICTRSAVSTTDPTRLRERSFGSWACSFCSP